jgi:hypothetical protein
MSGVARQRRFVAAVLLVAATAACGVPTSTEPLPVGKAPGFGGDVESPPVTLPGPDGAPDAKTLVERFLQAPAKGDWDPAASDQRIPQATEHARRFLTPEAARDWQPGNQITVVEVESVTPVSLDSVRVKVRGVGVLGVGGAIDPFDPLQGPSDYDLPFTAVRSDAFGGQYRLINAPDALLLSTQGLRELYEVRPVYFWDKRDRFLVPDRRYLSRGASRDKRIRAVVDRLLKGPSQFLESWVNTLPANTTRKGNPGVEESASKIVVDLSSAVSVSDKQLLRRIAAQLRWSLHPEALALALEIDGRPQGLFGDDSYLAYNPSASAAVAETDRLYVVADGRVVQHSTGARVPTVLEAAANTNVERAGVNRIRNSAAVVRVTGDTRELWIGRHGGETAAPQLTRVELPKAAAIGRPAFLPDVGNRVLVAADGVVYDVGDDATFRRVQAFEQYRDVGSIAVAPDGSRLAFLAGDRVYVTTLDSAAMTIGPARELYVPGLTRLREVAWGYEHQLVVAGATGLVEVAIDNGQREMITPQNLFAQEITHLAAVPRTAASGDVRGPIVLDVSGRVYNMYTSTGLDPVVVPGAQSPSARPSPSVSGAPAPAVPKLSAPFFLDVG